MLKSCLSVLTLLALLFTACGDKSADFLPKPKGYHRIELPAHQYQPLPDEYPYTFELSKEAKIYPDTSFMAEPHWIEIYYPELSATISVSYKDIQNNIDTLAGYFNDSHRLTNKHYIKATAIDEYVMNTPQGDGAVLFELEGDVPSQFQYFVTDSAKHFLRAALYFPVSTKNDSLAPVIQYVKEDMMHMLKTTDWRAGYKQSK